MDLTPSYVVDEDCAAFHAALKRTCDAHGASYADMKKTCDDYFYLPARREHRGVGGVFFDDLDAPWAGDFAVELMRGALADDGPYMPVATRRRGEAWSEAEKQWSVSVSFSTCGLFVGELDVASGAHPHRQYLRRGRYVESTSRVLCPEFPPTLPLTPSRAVDQVQPPLRPRRQVRPVAGERRARARVVAAARGVGLAEGARGGDARGGLLGGAAGAAGVGFVVRTGKSARLGARRVTPRARSHRGASCACCGVPKLDTRLDEREDRRKKRNRLYFCQKTP